MKHYLYLSAAMLFAACAQQILDQMIASGECKPCVLHLLNGSGPVNGYDAMLNADDFATWSDARKALVKTLKEL